MICDEVGWLVSGTKGVEFGRRWGRRGGEEGTAPSFKSAVESDAGSAGTSGISVSLSSMPDCSLSDEESLSSVLSFPIGGGGVTAFKTAADVSSDSSPLSDNTGVGEWLRKRAGRRVTTGDDLVEIAALADLDMLSGSGAGSASASVVL